MEGKVVMVEEVDEVVAVVMEGVVDQGTES